MPLKNYLAPILGPFPLPKQPRNLLIDTYNRNLKFKLTLNLEEKIVFHLNFKDSATWKVDIMPCTSSFRKSTRRGLHFNRGCSQAHASNGFVENSVQRIGAGVTLLGC